jgi:hypothetical protein
VKLEIDFFGFKTDLFICCVYDPPSNSSYSKELDHEILGHIEKEIEHFQKRGNVLLCGDFNARVGSENDFIYQDSNNFLPLFKSYNFDKQILKRYNKDKKLDSRGKDLIDLCISNQLRFVNGRVLGDTFGNFTCYTTHGANTVDYVLVSEGILDHILYLKVNDFVPCLSDCHCLIQWSISANYSNEHVHIENCNTIETSPGYKWSDESSFLFQEALSSPELKQRLDNFIQMGCRSNENEINNAATELANIIISAANKSLKRRNFTKNKKKNKNKKYFDTDLQILRKNLTNYGKYFSKYPCDLRIRGLLL